MENASKALIIAGAILISIILISIGIMVMRSTSGVKNEVSSQMDSEVIQRFNAKFTKYAGEQKGSTVKTLLSTIISNNATSDHSILYIKYDLSQGWRNIGVTSSSSAKRRNNYFDYNCRRHSRLRKIYRIH